MARARDGDVVAFEALVEARLARLHRTACAILDNESDAADAVQDACLSAWRELPKLRDVEAFDAWVSRVLVNSCRMLLRRRARVHEVAIAPHHDRPGPGSVGPEASNELDAIIRAFAHLDPDERSLLVLHHLRHEPLASIAAALHVPDGTVKSRLHAARASLEALLTEDES